MKTNSKVRRMTATQLAVAAAVTLALALGLSACQNVAGFTQPSLVRVIDAAYIAPAANVTVGGVSIASNIGQGWITPYSTVAASANVAIKMTAATGGATLVQSSGTLLAGHQHSVLIADNGVSPTSYEVTVLADQMVPAAMGHSAFRFINQAPKTGPVDIYLMPTGTTIANTLPFFSNVAVGQIVGYQSLSSQTVELVIAPTGTKNPKSLIPNSSGSNCINWALTGSEVNTVLIVDTQLTSDPPVQAFCMSDLSQ